MEGFEDEEFVRPSYQGELRHGAWVDGVFVSLTPQPGKPEPPKVLYAPISKLFFIRKFEENFYSLCIFFIFFLYF